jgi:hypothetical protein
MSVSGRPKSPPSSEHCSAHEDADADEQEQHEDEEQGHDHDEASLLARGGDGRREFGGDEKAPSKHRGLSFPAAWERTKTPRRAMILARRWHWSSRIADLISAATVRRKGGRSRPLNFSSRFVLEVSAFEPTIGPRGPLYLADPSMSAAGRCEHFN